MYEAHLRSLLSPLGIYDLEEHSASGAAVCALGTGLDTVSRRLEEIEREALTATAEGEGLARREALFARRPAAVTAEERRAAIAALLQIDGDSLTPAAIDRTIRGCGIRARARIPQPRIVRSMAAGVRLSPSICRRAAMAALRSSAVTAAGRRANRASRRASPSPSAVAVSASRSISSSRRLTVSSPVPSAQTAAPLAECSSKS